MIVLVDDDPAILHFVEETLVQAGHEVRAFDRGGDLLAFVTDQPPELIISDVMMPEMTGHELHQAYGQRFPSRRTPFVFLTSAADPADIVKGLNAGAEDYLTKPVAAPVLQAKVRSILARQRRQPVTTFTGELSKLPFPRLVQFCEASGLTGYVSVRSDDGESRVDFEAGELRADDALEEIDRLCELTEGRFTINSLTLDFSEIASAEVPPERRAVPPQSRPMGRLSGVRAGDRLFQIQTEYVAQPEPSVVTIVTVDGRTVSKQTEPTQPGAARAPIEAQMQALHRTVEQEVSDKASVMVAKRSKGAPSDRERFHSLFDAGYDCFRTGDYAGALDKWQQAQALDPSSSAIEVNLAVVKAKLGLTES